MVKIINRPSKSTYHAGYGNPKKFITVHQTSNWDVGANAEMHAIFLDNTKSASWHYTVDDTQAIQHFDDSIRCYHAGDGRGSGNYESIGIEACVNADGDYLKTLQNTAELVRHLMKKHNIPIERVVQHNRWSGKNCPIEIRRGRAGVTWNDFLAMVQGVEIKAAVQAPTVEVKGSTDDLAKRTINGEFGSGDTRKRKLGKRYNEVQNRVNEILLGGAKSKTIDELADEVIAGKHGVGDQRKQSLGSQYQAVQNKVNEKLIGRSSKPSKSTETLAHEVIAGVYGSGEDRKKALGSRYNEVQNRVNEILLGGGQKTINQLADEVMEGKHGTGDERKKSLGSRYNAVQKEVNRRYGI